MLFQADQTLYVATDLCCTILERVKFVWISISPVSICLFRLTHIPTLTSCLCFLAIPNGSFLLNCNLNSIAPSSVGRLIFKNRQIESFEMILERNVQMQYFEIIELLETDLRYFDLRIEYLLHFVLIRAVY